MTTAPTETGAAPLDPAGAGQLVALLESDFGREPADSAGLRYQHLLDALDRGHLERFTVFPAPHPSGALYAGPNGTVAVAGLPSAGPALAPAAERAGWRVLIGPEPAVDALLLSAPKGFFRRRPQARQQRFLVADPELVPAAAPAGFRRAGYGDVDVLADFACRLHVEDQMGPPIPRSARSAVRERMRESVQRKGTWVVERDGSVVGKFDVALRSRRRGAQIAGVYVVEAHRGQGIATEAVGALTAHLLDEGYAGVTLHVRADNLAGIRAYERAGYGDRGPLLLALR